MRPILSIEPGFNYQPLACRLTDKGLVCYVNDMKIRGPGGCPLLERVGHPPQLAWRRFIGAMAQGDDASGGSAASEDKEPKE